MMNLAVPVDLMIVHSCVDLFALCNDMPVLAVLEANRDCGNELTSKLADLGEDFLILRWHA
jgi:hypothetical protein